MTECTPVQCEFQGLGRRKVVAAFDGGHISSDGGALLLRETDLRLGVLERLAACFTDHRDPDPALALGKADPEGKARHRKANSEVRKGTRRPADLARRVTRWQVGIQFIAETWT